MNLLNELGRDFKPLAKALKGLEALNHIKSVIQTGSDWSKPETYYLQKEVQNGRVIGGGAGDLHGDALLQTLCLLLLK